MGDARRFATPADYEAMYGPQAETTSSRLPAVLDSATGLLLGAFEDFYGHEWHEGLSDRFDREAKNVCLAVAHRAFSAPAIEGATQMSQTGGQYNASVTFANPTGDTWLGRSDLKRLGLAGTRIGCVQASVGCDR